MKPVEIQVKINIARRELDFWERIMKDKRCTTCGHYAMPECEKFNAKPPPDVVAAGCEEWDWDEVPF